MSADEAEHFSAAVLPCAFCNTKKLPMLSPMFTTEGYRLCNSRCFKHTEASHDVSRRAHNPPSTRPARDLPRAFRLIVAVCWFPPLHARHARHGRFEETSTAEGVRRQHSRECPSFDMLPLRRQPT